MLASCTEPPTFIMPHLYVPHDFKTQVKTTPEKMDLSDQRINYIKEKMSEENKEFLNSLLYNYYDNYYGLQICNSKIKANSDYIDFYNRMALGIDNG